MKRAARIFWFGVLLLAILASAAMAEESSPVLTLPASLQQVEDYAFLNNTAIQQVVIPEGTTQIGQHAFEGCTGLKRVSIPAAVQKIGQGAFEGCTQLVIACEPFSYAYQYAVENGLKYELEPTPQERFTVARTSGRYGKITAYSGSDAVVVIPEKIGDYIIEEIGSSVFANNSQLTGVVLPAQMATIGSSAFSGCKNLVNVAINNKLETIGSSAFYGCSGLTSVTLNDGLKTIGSSAFYGCTRLTSIHIPDSVTTINSGAFRNCSKLAECNYPVGWTSAGNVIFKGTMLKTLEIPEGIKAIPASAFDGCDNFEYFDLPESLTQIQKWTFEDCTGLSEMVIPAKVETIGWNAFYGCSGLTSVTLNDGLKTIGSSAFEGCTRLTSIHIPDSVTTINSGAFRNCSKLAECNYPVGWTSAGNVIFKGTMLKTLEIPEGIKAIPASAFDGCDNFEYFDLPESLTQIQKWTFEDCTGLSEMVIPAKVETIGWNAFYGCSGLTSVTLNDGLKTIGSSAFEGCTRLTSIHIPDSVTTINSGAFRNCSKLAECNYPVGWTSAGNVIFKGTMLKTLEIPEGIKAIPASAFDGCDNFEYFDLPESLTQIQKWTFEDCTGLSEMVIPAKVETIGWNAFYGCSGLTSVTLNDGLKTIDSSAFEGCTRLTSIHIPDSVTTINSGAFRNCSKLAECNYPVGWTSAGNVIFKGTMLKTLEIPEGIKAIPASAFDGCDNFEYFDLPESLTQIQKWTFEDCTGLSEMVIPAKVETIGWNAFYGCSGLTSVTLNDGLKTISSYAFYGCTKLGKTYVPSSVTSIGSDAFGNCPNLKIFCEYGSTALQYAMKNNIPYYFLSLVNAWLPGGNLYQGDGYHISGQIRCSDPILSAQVRLYDAAGTVLRSGEVTNNAVLINLDTYLDSCIDLPSLALGNYSIEVLATTAEETKTFIRKSFTVIPPPLRVSLSGESIPSGLYKVGADFTLAGTIRSNYSITSVTAGVYKKDGTATSLVATVVPNALTYDLANLASTAQISLLTDGQYIYQITVTSNSQTLTLKRSAFGVGTAGGDGIDDEDIAKTLKFASKWENRGVFTNLTEYEDYLFSLNELDSFTIAMVSGDKVVWKLVWDMLTNSPTNSYAVELYKARIASAVEDQINSGFSGTGDLKIYKDVVDWTAKIASGTEIGLKDYFIRLEADYGAIKDSVNLLSYDYTVSAATYAGMLQLGEVVDGLELIGSGMEYISDMGEILKQVFCDYEAGTNVLDAVQKAMGLTGNADFDEAMRQIRIEYTNSFVGVTNWLVSECRDKIGKMAIKEILSFAAGNTYKLYSLAREIIFKVSGLEKRSNNNMKFATGLTVFFNAERAYQNAFDRVYNGDQSEEALRELLICFRFTYSCADSVYATLYELSSNKAEIQDAIDNKLHAISMN